MSVVLSFCQDQYDILSIPGEVSHTAILEELKAKSRAIHWLCPGPNKYRLPARVLVPDPEDKATRAPEWFAPEHVRQAETFATSVMGKPTAFADYCLNADRMVPMRDLQALLLRPAPFRENNGFPRWARHLFNDREVHLKLPIHSTLADGEAWIQHIVATLLNWITPLEASYGGAQGRMILTDVCLVDEFKATLGAGSYDVRGDSVVGNIEVIDPPHSYTGMIEQDATVLRTGLPVPSPHAEITDADLTSSPISDARVSFYFFGPEEKEQVTIETWAETFADPANRIPEWRDDRKITMDLSYRWLQPTTIR